MNARETRIQDVESDCILEEFESVAPFPSSSHNQPRATKQRKYGNSRDGSLSDSSGSVVRQESSPTLTIVSSKYWNMALDPSKFASAGSLDWTEYAALVVSLIATIGLSVWSYRTIQPNEYLGLRVPYAALVMSMIASSSSGVSLLGKPAEAYEYGTQFFVIQMVSLFCATLLSTELFLPIIYQLECSTIYEYFELRFHKIVRKLVTAAFTITKIFHTSIVALPPAIALNHLSGISMNVGITALTLITVFYTMLGGFKGVVWTDALQGVIMLISMLIIGVLSNYETGDFSRFLRVSYENNRFSLAKPTLGPTDRFPIWVYLTFAYTFSSVCLHQANFQRMKCMSTMKDAKKAIWFQLSGIVFFSAFAVVIGTSIYAYYFGCDPKEAQLVESYSQLVMFWLNSVGSRIRGLRGLYLAGIVSASISTISCNLNSLASLLETEFSCLRKHPSKRLFFQRALTVLIGSGVTVTGFFMKDSPSLIDLNFMCWACDGVIAGLFVLGVLVIPAEAKGAFAGGVISLISIVCLTVFKIMSPTSKVSHLNEFMRTDQCPFNVTRRSDSKKVIQSLSDRSYLLKLSPFIYGPLAVLTTISIGVLVSYAFPQKNPKYDSKLFSKLVHKYLPVEAQKDTVQMSPLIRTNQIRR